MSDRTIERRILQCVVAVLALLPVSAGMLGVLRGPAFLGVDAGWPTDLDSHLRFLSGVFLAMAIGWWSCIPDIERKGERMRMLGLCTICGGLARAASLAVAGAPSTPHLVGLGMELVVVPLLLLWQARIARS